jgi:hypothetical protein
MAFGRVEAGGGLSQHLKGFDFVGPYTDPLLRLVLCRLGLTRLIEASYWQNGKKKVGIPASEGPQV